jgi:hypothetical protein
MKNLFLSAALIALPVGGFAAAWHLLPHAAEIATTAAAPGLGDMSVLQAIVTDTQSIAAKGDLVAAEKRITDLEVAWDAVAAELRAKDANAWAAVDDAADASFKALRAKTPDAAEVKTALAVLAQTLQAPFGVAAPQGVVMMVSGVAVTDANGHTLPCEVMLNALKTAAEAAGRVADVAAFQAKGTERCNADDDKHAAEFFAQGLALLAK